MIIITLSSNFFLWWQLQWTVTKILLTDHCDSVTTTIIAVDISTVQKKKIFEDYFMSTNKTINKKKLGIS